MSRRVETSLCCSFCHKSEKSVGKLISNPSDYPRAYICDECIAVCQAIIEDDAEQQTVLDLDKIFQHPQMVELIGALQCWVDRETRGENAEEELAEVRRLAMQVLPYQVAESNK